MENWLCRPLDIEWALTGGQFSVLQDRPIPQAPKRSLRIGKSGRINATEVMRT